MRFSFYFLLLWLMAPMVYGQETNRIPWMARENRIGIALGIASVSFSDKNTSPLVYQSKPKMVRLFYQLESNHMLITLDIDVKVGSTKAKHIANRMLFFQEEDYQGKKEDKKFPVGGSLLAGRISVGAFYKISSTQHSTFRVEVGGKISNELFYPQGWTSAGIFNALSFSPEGIAQHRIDDSHALTASFRLPLVTQLTRLPYYNTVSHPDKSLLGGFFRNKEWGGIGKYAAPALQVGYTYNINTNWGTGLSYELNWYNITTPQLMRATTHSFLANAHCQF